MHFTVIGTARGDGSDCHKLPEFIAFVDAAETITVQHWREFTQHTHTRMF